MPTNRVLHVKDDSRWQSIWIRAKTFIFKCDLTVVTALRKVLFLAPSVCWLLSVYEISREPLSGLAPNYGGRRVWSFPGTSLKVKDSRSTVKGQGHHGQKRHFSALSEACVRFMFGKTSLAFLVFLFFSLSYCPK